MRVLALLGSTRGERRAYAAALGALARRGHAVTLAVPPGARAFASDLPGATLEVLAPKPDDPPPRPNPGPIDPVLADLSAAFPLGRAAHDRACALEVEALLLDAATGPLAVAPACARGGRRKVALRLPSWEELARAREPNLGLDDDARFMAHEVLTEFVLGACEGGTIAPAGVPEPMSHVKHRAQWIIPPAVPPGWHEGAPPLFALLGRPLIACVGPWMPASGFDLVVRAFSEVRRTFPEATLVASGEGAYAFRPRREFRWVALDRCAGEARGAIHLVDDDDVTLRALYSSADLLLHAWVVPGSGTAIAEAREAEVPVIASDIAAHREACEAGRDALLVPPGEAGPLAEAALALLRDRDRARSLARRGRERAREERAWARLLDGLEAALA